MQTFNIVKNKIKELNDYNNISFYNEVLKYNIVHIGDETSIIQRNILDKITKEEKVCETIELTNWIIENYDTGSLNYYLREFITKLELRELELWKQRGQERLGVWFEMLRLLLTDNKYWILLIDENVVCF